MKGGIDDITPAEWDRSFRDWLGKPKKTTVPISLPYNKKKKISKVKSDGGSTSYYALPKGATDLQDLIDHKDMNYAVGNIFKAAYRLGEKEGNTREYELQKILWFVNRLLRRYEGWR